jgi:hypothetical protein
VLSAAARVIIVLDDKPTALGVDAIRPTLFSGVVVLRGSLSGMLTFLRYVEEASLSLISISCAEWNLSEVYPPDPHFRFG